jgi:hypothetical protein
MMVAELTFRIFLASSLFGEALRCCCYAEIAFMHLQLIIDSHLFTSHGHKCTQICIISLRHLHHLNVKLSLSFSLSLSLSLSR